MRTLPYKTGKVLQRRLGPFPDVGRHALGPRPVNGIRLCSDLDLQTMLRVINDAAQAYKGVIPDDCWREPYMPAQELREAAEQGVEFWGIEHDGELVGIMGVQPVQDVTLIRHAYVLTNHRRQGVGSRLLRYLLTLTRLPTLVGTWEAATWAISFYKKHGFRLVSASVKDDLLRRYWGVPGRQIETSVVLADERWFGGAGRQ